MRPSAHPFRPPKAVGEHEAQLPWSRLSQSISSLALLAFTSLLATMRRSDFCVGVVPSSLPPSGLPLMADPRRPPWVMTLNVPPLPLPIPLRPRMDFGRRVRRHADRPVRLAQGFTHVRCCGVTSGFFPTRPHGASAGVSRRQALRAVASSSRLLPPRPAKDFHLQSSAHARHTRQCFQRPPMRRGRPMQGDSSDHFQRRLAAILAADVVGYSRLMSVDEIGTLSALKAHRVDGPDGRERWVPMRPHPESARPQESFDIRHLARCTWFR
jgi:hypothetical protein